ncbi:MAG: hypothetical protein HY078_06975 [Elusimicrobia bacterium]|nr:hypothetical protein [Elusimicrobiota bacterium]
MKRLAAGKTVELRARVRPWMRPRLEGLVRHRLYSTWAMAYHMETAARKLLAPALDPGEEAVGGGLRVRHLAPAPIGAVVRVVCRLAGVRRGRVRTRLDVYLKNHKIGEGEHLQVVMPRARFETLGRRA